MVLASLDIREACLANRRMLLVSQGEHEACLLKITWFKERENQMVEVNTGRS